MKTATVVLATMLALLIAPTITAEGHGRKLKQGAGVGAGCNSVFNAADNGSGYLIEDTEDNLAGDLGGSRQAAGGASGKKLLSYLGLAAHKRSLKQGAGVGAGCDSVFTEADNGSGYLVEDTENALAGDVNNRPGGKKLLAASAGRTLQQANKIADGANNLLTAAGDPQAGAAEDVFLNDLDNQGTNDAAAEGAQVGDLEASLPELASFIPGRKMLGNGRALQQANKIADGGNNLLTAAGDPQAGGAEDVFLNDLDNQGTNDAAADGAMVGDAEASLPELASFIPGRH